MGNKTTPRKIIDLDSPEFVRNEHIHFIGTLKDGNQIDVIYPVSRLIKEFEQLIIDSKEQDKKQQEWLNNRSKQSS